jgi:hypothetical protein
VVNRLLEKLGDECTQLFPHGYLPVITEQITEYWRKKRAKILNSLSPLDQELKYLPQIECWRCHHGFKVPGSYVVPARSALATLVSKERMRKFSLALLGPEKNKLFPNPHGGPNYPSGPEHEMIILPTPPLDNPHVGHLIAHARNKDKGGVSEKHIICFSTIHLLYQVFVAGYRYSWAVMTSINSTHGADSDGGKLQSFGISATNRHGRGSDYRHTFLPLVFARILEES